MMMSHEWQNGKVLRTYTYDTPSIHERASLDGWFAPVSYDGDDACAALRNLANYLYQIPQRPDQLTLPSLGDSIRSLEFTVTCGEDVLGGSCGDLIS